VKAPTPVKIVASVGLVAVLAVLAFAIFGSSSNSSVDPVAQAATRSASLPGVKMLLTMKLSSPALPAIVSGSGNATFSTASHKGALTLALKLPNSPAITSALGSNTLRINEIIDGATIYMQLPGALMHALGDAQGKQWISLNIAKLAGVPGLSSLGSNPAESNPSEMLQYLRGASSNFTTVGHEVVDGFQTTHYRADVSLDKEISRLPATDQQALKQILQQSHLSQIPMDAWIDSHHLVRRMQLNLHLSSQGQPLAESITIDFPQYGPQPAPTIPPASDVQAITLPAAG
jgi:hypothetical protein